MIRNDIRKLIEKAVKELGFKVPEVLVEEPREKAYGNYATNVAMTIGKEDPIKIAEMIKSKIKSNIIEKIDVVKPGFINFFISKEYLQEQVGEILKEKEKFGDLKLGKGKKVQVEFISANPTGPLTVGNARGGPFGDALGNILKKAGFNVEKAFYINNYGMQILALGNSVLKNKEAKYKGKYIDYLSKKIKGKDPYKAGEKAAKIIVDEMIKKTADRMGIKYDEWFSETKLHKSGEVDKVSEFLKKKGLAYKKEGALWFKSTKFGDNRDRVIIKKDSWKTYLAGDIAYHKYKFEKKKFDKVIDVWGADHAGDVFGLQAGMTAFGHKGKLDIILLQFVTLLEKKKKIKMSKRRGVYVAMDELLDKVGADVTKFFFLQKSADTHLNFDVSIAKEQSEKNPVYYVQYAHARICSILRKAKGFKFQVSSFRLLDHPSELSLIKRLIRFPEIIGDTAKDYQVQRVPQYATDLATEFHKFYRDCKVISDDKELSQARLSLILATQTVLKNTLDLMGISAPKKM
ncbi:arginine--tRNA ligase [Patescibacteria group bacterium]|nr:arginine--tRNA ligase [Patescibacteria group bacterium]